MPFFSTATPYCCGLRNFGQHDLGVAVGRFELTDQAGDAALDDIVTQEHHKTIVAQEIARDLDGVSQSQRGLLRDVGDLHAPARAVAHGLSDFGAGIAHHDADIGDARPP